MTVPIVAAADPCADLAKMYSQMSAATSYRSVDSWIFLPAKTEITTHGQTFTTTYSDWNTPITTEEPK